jgi:hypothetical protein
VTNKDERSKDLSPDFVYEDTGSEEPSWFASRRHRSNFFRYNKKAYRMIEGEGWKQIEDPRDELPDYERAKAFRDKKRRVESHYSRIRRKRTREANLNRIIHRHLDKS